MAFHKTRYAIQILCIICLGLTSACSANQENPLDHALNERPNVIVILADDLGYGDIQAYSSKSKIPTPNLDALALSGVRFTDAHSPSSVCTPSRYGLLTGRYAWRTSLKKGVLQGNSPSLITKGRQTIASLFKKAGYTTGAIGKWHLGLGDAAETDFSKPFSSGPTTVGFDYFFGIPASLDMAPFVYIENDRVTEAPTAYIEEGVHRRDGGQGYWQAGAIAPSFKHGSVAQTIADRAVDFIRQNAASSADNPFFLYLPLTAPHKPWMPSEAALDKSGAGPYGDFVVDLDTHLGQIIAALKASGLYDDTLIVFTSDNGSRWEDFEIEQYEHLANGSLRGQKTEIWEGGHRVPLIVSWPARIEAGKTNDSLISLTDFFATFAELIHQSYGLDSGEDSISFLAALLQPSGKSDRSDLIMHSSQGVFAIRRQGWKFIEKAGSGGYLWEEDATATKQLYDLDHDVDESENLITERSQIASELQEALNSQRSKSRSAPMPETTK